jgi:hypothetical protein
MRECWLISLVLWQEHLAETHRVVPETARDQKRLARLVEALDWALLKTLGKAEEKHSRLESLREALAEILARHVIACWQQVRALRDRAG